MVLNTLKDSVSTRILCDFLKIAPKWKKKEVTWCKGQSPEGGEFTINSDGVVTDTDYGFGGSIRNQAGDPIIYYNGKAGSDSVLKQELRGIEVGLKVVKELGINYVTIVSDSTLTVNTVTGKKEEPWYLKNLVRNIKNLCNVFHNFHVYHCYRETNHPADWLARRRWLGECGVIYFSSPLELELMKLVKDDANGTWYQR